MPASSEQPCNGKCVAHRPALDATLPPQTQTVSNCDDGYVYIEATIRIPETTGSVEHLDVEWVCDRVMAPVWPVCQVWEWVQGNLQVSHGVVVTFVSVRRGRQSTDGSYSLRKSSETRCFTAQAKFACPQVAGSSQQCWWSDVWCLRHSGKVGTSFSAAEYGHSKPLISNLTVLLRVSLLIFEFPLLVILVVHERHLFFAVDDRLEATPAVDPPDSASFPAVTFPCLGMTYVLRIPERVSIRHRW